jgi:hypothetical protein
MEMPCLKTGRDAARRRFWLAMSGFVIALALMPFSYKVERRLAVSSLDWPDPLFTGNDGGALIIVGLDLHDRTVEALVPILKAKAEWMEGQLRSQYPDVKLEITGEAPLSLNGARRSAVRARQDKGRYCRQTLPNR